MQQGSAKREFSLILEEGGQNRAATGRTRQNTGGRQYKSGTVLQGGRANSAGRGRGGADIQLWTDDGAQRAHPQRSAEREAQMRYKRAMRRKKRRRQIMIVRAVVGSSAVVMLFLLIFVLWKLGSFLWSREKASEPASAMQREEAQFIADNQSQKPFIEEDFLTPNEYSRPGEPLPEVTEIFVHYTANAGTSAAQNRSYFENLGITGETSASAHFVIGYEGEIIQCLPLDEIGYAVKEHNYNSVSIECCYLREDGKFEDATYQSLLKLLGWLMNEYDLGPSAIKRHYDSSGKLCPKYFVEHEDAWEQLLADLKNEIS